MIYADYNGSTPVSSEVKEYLINRLNGPFANPNAIHSLGENINNALEKCREICAEVLGASPEQIIFTSGSSEAISQIFHSIKKSDSKEEILLSPLEHAAVINSAREFKTKFCDVDKNGLIVLPENKKFSLACLIHAHNETGVIQDVKKFSKWCEENKTPFFCDSTQSIGKTHFNFKELGADYAVLSSHKIGGLIGAGILLAKNPETLKPLIYGGGQERSLRGGTQNYLAIECMTVALKNIDKRRKDYEDFLEKKIQFESRIQKIIPESLVIADKSTRLPNTTLLSIKGIHGQAMQIELESRDIFVTTSSACSDNEPSTSETLKAMGYTDDIGRGVIRISLSPKTNNDELDYLEKSILESYNTLKKVRFN